MGKNEQTATQAYEEHQKDIGVLMDCIRMELEVHQEQAKDEGIHWGHVGDLGHVKEQAKQILMFLLNADSEEDMERLIESHLEDLKN